MKKVFEFVRVVIDFIRFGKRYKLIKDLMKEKADKEGIPFDELWIKFIYRIAREHYGTNPAIVIYDNLLDSNELCFTTEKGFWNLVMKGFKISGNIKDINASNGAILINISNLFFKAELASKCNEISKFYIITNLIGHEFTHAIQYKRGIDMENVNTLEIINTEEYFNHPLEKEALKGGIDFCRYFASRNIKDLVSFI